jgi:hypothetical protein
MSEADGTFPTTVTGKRKRRSRFRYSTKKALERSRLSKKTAKGRIFEFASVTKTLVYPSALLSEIGVVDLRDCSTGSIGLASLHSVDENEVERIDVSIGFANAVAECFKKVSILRYILH